MGYWYIRCEMWQFLDAILLSCMVGDRLLGILRYVQIFGV